MSESEISINLENPLARTSLKARLYKIFSLLGINEERDLGKIICIAQKQQQQPPTAKKLISKIKIQFKSTLSFDKMVEFLGHENAMADYEFNEFSTGNSPTPSESSGGQLINGNESPTSWAGLTTSSLYPSSLTVSSTSPTNNLVEFYSHRLIEPADLETLVLFLENRRASGGGETVERPQLDVSRHMITVNYEHAESKKRTIHKQIHSFRGFSVLNANEPFDREKCQPDNRVLLLWFDLDEPFFSNIDAELLDLYLENLVDNGQDENGIEWKDKSKFMKNVLIVRYKLEFDFNRVTRRMERAPYLNDVSIKCYEAYETRVLVAKQARAPFDADFIHSYLLSIATTGSYSIKPFSSTSAHFVYFNHLNECEQTLSNGNQQSQAHFEYVYNVDLFEATTGHLFAHQEQALETPTIMAQTLFEQTIGGDFDSIQLLGRGVNTSTPYNSLLISMNHRQESYLNDSSTSVDDELQRVNNLHRIQSGSVSLQLGWSIQNDWELAREIFLEFFQKLESLWQQGSQYVLESVRAMRLSIHEKFNASPQREGVWLEFWDKNARGM